MRGSGDSIVLRGADAPAPEVEERSDEAPGAGIEDTANDGLAFVGRIGAQTN